MGQHFPFMLTQLPGQHFRLISPLHRLNRLKHSHSGQGVKNRSLPLGTNSIQRNLFFRALQRYFFGCPQN